MDKQIIELMEVIEEQQILIKLLLELYPESPEKAEILESARRIRNKTKSVKSTIKFVLKHTAT